MISNFFFFFHFAEKWIGKEDKRERGKEVKDCAKMPFRVSHIRGNKSCVILNCCTSTISLNTLFMRLSLVFSWLLFLFVLMNFLDANTSIFFI